MKIGDRVKVKKQNITGVIIRYDLGNKFVILDDDDSWQVVGEEASLTYNKDDLKLITNKEEK